MKRPVETVNTEGGEEPEGEKKREEGTNGTKLGQRLKWRTLQRKPDAPSGYRRIPVALSKPTKRRQTHGD